MVLLHLLWTWREAWNITLTAATFDHCLRPTSGEDAAFVHSWCEKRDIPCILGRGEVAEYAKSSGETVEQAARTLRYRFLQGSAAEVGADYIATAHNADDNAETLLLHLLRGSGLNGLGGIPPRRENIVRPLLAISREEIAAYAAVHQIPFREDESNADTAYTRNFLRHQVMPLLRSRNPALTQTLCRTAENLRRDEMCLSAWAQRETEPGNRISAKRLAAMPESIALRVIENLAEQTGGGAVLPQNQREGVLALAQADSPSAQLSLSGGLTARREYDLLILEAKSDTPSGFAPVTLTDRGRVGLPGLTLLCRAGDCLKQEEPGALYLRGGEQPLLIRSRQTGDALKLPNRGTKTVKKWMIDAKIPRIQREILPVFVIGGQTAAVWGMGRDMAWIAQPGEPYWEIRTEKNNEIKENQHGQNGS